MTRTIVSVSTILSLALLFIGCNNTGEAPKINSEPTKIKSCADSTALYEAIYCIKPKLEDGNKISRGVVELLKYFHRNVNSLSHISILESTTFLEFVKDPYINKGKKLSGIGRVIQISAVRSKIRHSQFESPLCYETLIVVGGTSHFIKFLHIGNAKNIVEGSIVRFSGIALQNHSFRNIGGGITLCVIVMGKMKLWQYRR